MDDAGNEKADLKMPNDGELTKQIEEGVAADKELVITILKVNALDTTDYNRDVLCTDIELPCPAGRFRTITASRPIALS
eukprot:1184599-Prorocentrum_minimum.AAC.12